MHSSLPTTSTTPAHAPALRRHQPSAFAPCHFPGLLRTSGSGAALRGSARHGIHRRTMLAGSLASSLLLAGCGPSARPTSTSNEVSFTFWGPSFYQEFTAQMVEAFRKAAPDVDVALQPSEWAATGTSSPCRSPAALPPT